MLVPGSGRLGNRRRDVSKVDTPMADGFQPSIQARVPDRGGAHVDAAAPGAEIEGCADHGDGMALRLHGRGQQG